MSNLKFDFTGRSVIVTGAARGIGLELARFFQEPERGCTCATSTPTS